MHHFIIGEKAKKTISYLSIFLIITLGICFYAKFLPKNSFGAADNNLSEVEEKNDETPIEYETEEVSNGFIKANIINGTNYDTEYKETVRIMISKQEDQDKIWFRENNTFLIGEKNENDEEIDKELENNNELIYKSTKLYKDNLIKILGENYKLELLDAEQNIIEVIDENTKWAEDGTYTVNYQNIMTSLLLKTSKIQDVGILKLENTKIIKSSMTVDSNIRIKSTSNLYGINEDIINEEDVVESGEEKNNIIRKIAYKNKKENIVDIKDSKTNIEFNINKTEWKNKEQNEILFEITLNSKNMKDSMFKNPKIKITLPEEVEKVILGEGYIIYGQELKLNSINLETDQNDRKNIVINIDGIQTKYYTDDLELIPSIKIPATIILKKDIKKTTSDIKLICINELNDNKQYEEEILEKEISLENYNNENVINNKQSTRRITKTNSNGSSISEDNNTSAVKTDVSLYKGDKKLGDNDIIYEGEFIKYVIQVTNMSEEIINNIKVNATIPENAVYAELKADYNNYMGEYKYNYDDTVSNKSIDIEILNPGETYNAFYEVKVKDLEENSSNHQLQNTVNTYIDDSKVNTSNFINTIEKSDLRIFLGAFLDNSEDRWNYSLKVESADNKQVNTKIVFPKGFKLEVRVEAGGQDGTYLPTYLNTDENNEIVDTIETNKEYWYEGVIDSTVIEESPEGFPVILKAYATVDINGKEYKSNENRIAYESRSVSVIMTSENEGEEVDIGDEINYEIVIKNTGKTNLIQGNTDICSVDVKDYLPENLTQMKMEYEFWEENEDNWVKKVNSEEIYKNVKDSEGHDLPNIDLTINIPYGEKVKIKIKTKADYVQQKTKIQNSVTVSGNYIKTKISNIISHTIMSSDMIVNNEDNEDNNIEAHEQPEEIKQVEEKNINKTDKYNISGIAWIDENEDGAKQDSEQLEKGIEVLLVNENNTSKVFKKTNTDNYGKYQFDDLDSGKYIVLFKYNEDNYILTEYQKDGISNIYNSNVNKKEITLNGQKITVGATDIIELNSNISGINIGLIKNGICDLRLDKFISTIKVETRKNSRQYSYDKQKLAKVEIHSKEIEGATVEVEYKIIVTNEGEIPASIEKVIDYLPDGFDSVQEKNEGWSKSSKGEMINTSLSNKKLTPGESVELTFVLAKKMTADSTGEYKNSAEIGEISNVHGVLDKDSTYGNKTVGEDDYSEATLIISIGTGGIIYISIITLLIVVFIVTLIILSKKGILKNQRIKIISKITIFILVLSGIVFTGDNVAWSDNNTDKQLVQNKLWFSWLPNSSHQNAYGSVCFISSDGKEAHCQNAGLPAYTGYYNYGGASGLISTTSTVGTNENLEIELYQDIDDTARGVNIKEEGDYWIYGPMKFNVKTNRDFDGITYDIEAISNTKKLSGDKLIILDENENQINTISGAVGNKVFYIKIEKKEIQPNRNT